MVKKEWSDCIKSKSAEPSSRKKSTENHPGWKANVVPKIVLYSRRYVGQNKKK